MIAKVLFSFDDPILWWERKDGWCKGEEWRESYMGYRRWEDRRKGSGKERWMGRVCGGETEMRQRAKHRERLRDRRSQRMKREDQFSGFSLSVSGLHYCPPHPLSPRLWLLEQILTRPLCIGQSSLFPQQSAQLAFLLHLTEYLWDKGWFSCTVPKAMHLCVPTKYESVSVYYNVMAFPKEACPLLLGICYSRHIVWNFHTFQ